MSSPHTPEREALIAQSARQTMERLFDKAKLAYYTFDGEPDHALAESIIADAIRAAVLASSSVGAGEAQVKCAHGGAGICPVCERAEMIALARETALQIEEYVTGDESEEAGTWGPAGVQRIILAAFLRLVPAAPPAPADDAQDEGR